MTTAPRRNRVGWTWILLSSLAIAVCAVTPYLTTPAVPFLAWLPNVVVAERLIRRRRLPAFRLAGAHAPAREPIDAA